MTKKEFAQFIHPELYQGPGLSLFNRVFLFLTLFAAIIVVIETEVAFQKADASWLSNIELILAFIFAGEFLVRWFTCSEMAQYKNKILSWNYLLSPWVIIDLLAFLPTLILLTPTDTVAVRILRLLKFARFIKLGRYSKSLNKIFSAFYSKRFELAVSVFISFIFLMTSAIALYMIEGQAQPEAFGSIPRALWWSVITLTTVGYGDVYPITVLGKVVAGFIAYIAIGSIALPAGILASALMVNKNN